MTNKSACYMRLLLLAGSALLLAGSPAGSQVPDGQKPFPTAELRAPDRTISGFPVWVGADGKLDRLVVVAEGFDLYQEFDPPALIQRVRPLAEALWRSGVDIMVVDFPDSYGSPDQQAPRLTQAIRAGAEAAGAKVTLVGYSAGGITARWALSAAEGSGSPLPCRALITVDTPHRGAWINPALQAMAVRHGESQYWLRLGAGAPSLKGTGLTLATVCQANSSVLPRLKDGGSTVHFEASGRAVVSAGPTLPQAQAHLVDGAFGTPRVTLELRTPRGENALELVVGAHIASSNPPSADVKYQAEYSLDGGKSWQPVVKDWSIPRQGDEPKDFWSQSMCWGSVVLPKDTTGPVRVRFRNDGGKAYLRAEAHLAYRTQRQDPTRVTFAWSEEGGEKQAARAVAQPSETWTLPTGRNVRTRWVEYRPEP